VRGWARRVGAHWLMCTRHDISLMRKKCCQLLRARSASAALGDGWRNDDGAVDDDDFQVLALPCAHTLRNFQRTVASHCTQLWTEGEPVSHDATVGARKHRGTKTRARTHKNTHANTAAAAATPKIPSTSLARLSAPS
jgi:hypothetical protein